MARARYVSLRQEQTADIRLPNWARRSHPIVRRHLGLSWRTLAPDYGNLLRVYLFQVGIIAMTFVFPFLFNIIVPMVMVLILFLPIAIGVYAYCLYRIAVIASHRMAREMQQESVELLKMSPKPLSELLLAQAAAAMWKRIDLISTLLTLGAFLSLPGIMAQYANLWSPYQYPLYSRVAMALGLAAILLRLLLEPFMVGVIGVVMGVAAPYRNAALLWSLGVTAMYFLITQLLRQLPLFGAARFAVEIGLPIIAPIVIIGLMLRLGLFLLRPD